MTKSFVFRIYLCFFNKSIVLCLIYTSERLLLFYNSFWLYTLQLYIAGNFQVVRSHYLAKKSYIYLNISRILRFRFLFFHFFSFDKCLLPCRLHKVAAAFWAANRFVGSKRPKHNVFDQFWKCKFHFEHFPRKTRFLSFNGPSNYLYLFKNHRQTFKLLKCDFAQTLNTFRNLFLQMLLSGRLLLLNFTQCSCLTLKCLLSTESSYILKQTYSWKV